jgi:hypothetical protein
MNLKASLLKEKITFIGTVRNNKREIPAEFLPSKKREIQSSIFGHHKSATLVSYVPKKNKAVTVLSTMHHDNDICSETKKPDLIMVYN